MTQVTSESVAHTLSEADRAALTDLVIRGMRRGGAPELDGVVRAGLAIAKGPVTMPTAAAGRMVGEWYLMPAPSPERDQVDALFRAFLPVNRKLRELCTAWQCRPDGSPNDHSDAGYDAGVRDRLDDIHADVLRIVRRLAKPVPGLARYREDLTAALAALDGGDLSALTSPLSDSYHTVWMRLHQELIMLLGLTRAEDEALEESLVAELAG